MNSRAGRKKSVGGGCGGFGKECGRAAMKISGRLRILIRAGDGEFGNGTGLPSVFCPGEADGVGGGDGGEEGRRRNYFGKRRGEQNFDGRASSGKFPQAGREGETRRDFAEFPQAGREGETRREIEGLESGEVIGGK